MPRAGGERGSSDHLRRDVDAGRLARPAERAEIGLDAAGDEECARGSVPGGRGRAGHVAVVVNRRRHAGGPAERGAKPRHRAVAIEERARGGVSGSRRAADDVANVVDRVGGALAAAKRAQAAQAAVGIEKCPAGAERCERAPDHLSRAIDAGRGTCGPAQRAEILQRGTVEEKCVSGAVGALRRAGGLSRLVQRQRLAVCTAQRAEIFDEIRALRRCRLRRQRRLPHADRRDQKQYAARHPPDGHWTPP